MASTLFILNEAPYGSERAYNALRLAGTLAGREGQQVRVFLLADAVGCARAGQKLRAGKGYRVRKILDGVAEWQAAGMPLERAGDA